MFNKLVCCLQSELVLGFFTYLAGDIWNKCDKGYSLGGRYIYMKLRTDMGDTEIRCQILEAYDTVQY